MQIILRKNAIIRNVNLFDKRNQEVTLGYSLEVTKTKYYPNKDYESIFLDVVIVESKGKILFGCSW